jgi:hypothetical protein
VFFFFLSLFLLFLVFAGGAFLAAAYFAGVEALTELEDAKQDLDIVLR